MSRVHEALIEVMRAVQPIAKSERNVQSNYAARGIDDVMNELHEHLAAAGLIVMPFVEQVEYTEHRSDRGTLMTTARVLVTYKFVAEDGTTETMRVQSEGRDAADKGTNKALSSALKYGLLHTFLIPTGDRDADTETLHVEATQTQRREAEATLRPPTKNVSNWAKAQLVEIVGNEKSAAELYETILSAEGVALDAELSPRQAAQLVSLAQKQVLGT